MSLWHIVTCMQTVFYCSSILIWNEIMNKIEVSISFPQFKIVLKQYLLVNTLIKDVELPDLQCSIDCFFSNVICCTVL